MNPLARPARRGRRLAAPLALLAGLTLAGPPALAAEDAFPFAVHQRTLDNGLSLVAIPYDSPGVIAYYTVVRTGSRNEVERGRTGFAHFFEHMMFRGTERYSQEQYNDVLKRMGADSNAWTWNDQTVYFIVAGAEQLATIVEVEADRFQNLSYSKADFQKEARAVLGEYNKSASNPARKMREVLQDVAFTRHTYKHTTMGFLADIEAMPEGFDYSRKFFDRYYRPDNVAVVVVGDVDPERFFATAKAGYGAWGKGGKRPKVPTEPPQRSERRKEMTWPAPTLPRLVMGYHAPAFSTTDIDHPAMDVLASLAFSERSPLYRRLVIEEQKVEELSGWNPSTVDPHLFIVSAVVKDAADLEYVEGVISGELARIAEEGADPKSLAEVVSHMRYGFAGGLATANDVASTAAWYLSLTGQVGAVNAWYRLLGQVSSEDVKRAAARYLVPQNRTVVTLVSEVKQ